MVWTARAQGGTSRSHTSNIVPAKLAERVWCTKFQSSLLDIYFRLSGFQPSILLIYFFDGPNRCSHCTKIWQKTYSRSARRRFAPSQKSRRHNSFYVWTEALSGMIFVAAQTPSGTRCGHTLRRAVTANKCTQKAWCTCRVILTYCIFAILVQLPSPLSLLKLPIYRAMLSKKSWLKISGEHRNYWRRQRKIQWFIFYESTRGCNMFGNM